jgi:hypothetical protein
MKGKTTHQKPSLVVRDIVEHPPELMEAQGVVDHCFDIILINAMHFLATIFKREYCTIE